MGKAKKKDTPKLARGGVGPADAPKPKPLLYPVPGGFSFRPPELQLQLKKAKKAKKARLPGGRPREYDVDAITTVAENLARDKGVDDHLDPFCVRVRDECGNKRPRIKTPKSRSQMRKICRPIFDAARPAAKK